jgi:hypothetical protein
MNFSTVRSTSAGLRATTVSDPFLTTKANRYSGVLRPGEFSHSVM